MVLQATLTALIFIGTYTRPESFVNGKGKGIYTLLLNKTDGSMSDLRVYPEAGVNPSYVTLSNSGEYLFAVNEVADNVTSNGRNQSGAVVSFRVEPKKQQQLTLLSRQVSEGKSPCHIRTDKSDSVVFVSNYGSGNVAVMRIGFGRLAKAEDIKYNKGGGSGVVPNRQEAGHFHCMVESPDNNFVFEADLGADKIMQYRLDSKFVVLTDNSFMSTMPGSGPRQFTFHPSLNTFYIINELDNTITVATFDPTNGRLKLAQTVRSLPNDFVGLSSAADIHVSDNGKFLYAANRGHDSIAVFGIEPASGLLSNGGEAVEYVSTEGSAPRNFIIHGDILLVANQNSDSIVSFRMNAETGRLSKLAQFSVPTPTCLKLLDLPDSSSAQSSIRNSSLLAFIIVICLLYI